MIVHSCLQLLARSFFTISAYVDLQFIVESIILLALLFQSRDLTFGLTPLDVELLHFPLLFVKL